MKKNNIFETLKNDYYSNNSEFSVNTSSHWKKYGKYQKINNSRYGYNLRGIGFGGFSRNNLLQHIKNIPVKIYLSKLLKSCDKDLVDAIKKIAKNQKRVLCYDLARMALTLNQVTKKIENIDEKRFCIIGDGYGSLGTLIKSIYPKSKVTFVNLGKTLIFDFYYTNLCHPQSKHVLIRKKNDKLSLDFNYVEAENFNNIFLEADIFFNINSMQEMDYQQIKTYMKNIRNQKKESWFYCCNRVSKTLPDGTLIEFSKYGWSKNDKILIDELCPWTEHFPINYPPFIKKFDGLIKHKLVKIN